MNKVNNTNQASQHANQGVHSKTRIARIIATTFAATACMGVFSTSAHANSNIAATNAEQPTSTFLGDVMPLHTHEVSLDAIRAKSIGTGGINQASASAHTTETNDTNVIDVVVFYQPTFMAHWGDQVGYERIHNLVEYANEALINSGIDGRFRIVKVTPTVNIPDDLHYLSIKQDDGTYLYGASNLFSQYALNEYEGHTEYDIYHKYSGDVVMYFRDYRDEETEQGRPRGFASLAGELATILDWKIPYPEDHAMDSTVSHELGHVLGGNHERAKNAFPVHIESYASAYECDNNATAIWSTISSGETKRHNFYSSPDIEVNGEKCGVAIGESDEADNASAIKKNVPIAASRMPSIASLGHVAFDETMVLVDKTAGEVTLTLTRDGDMSHEANVEVAALDGSAKQTQDFVEGYQEAIFAAGESTAQVTFTLVAGGETSVGNLHFTASMRYPYKLTPVEADSVVLITNNQTNITGDFAFDTFTASEQSQQACSVLNRTNGDSGEVVFALNVQSDTASDEDYHFDMKGNGFVVFADGQTSQEVCIDIVDDMVDEGEEAFNVTLSTLLPVNYPASTTVTIIDNDGVDFDQGEIAFENSTVTISETQVTAQVNVLRTNGSDGDVTVSVAMEYVSATSSDIELVTTEITFVDGQTTGVVELILTNDSAIESDETVNLTLTAKMPTNLTVSTVPMVVTITSEDVSAPTKPSTSGDSDSGGGSFGYLLGLIALVGLRKRLGVK